MKCLLIFLISLLLSNGLIVRLDSFIIMKNFFHYKNVWIHGFNKKAPMGLAPNSSKSFI